MALVTLPFGSHPWTRRSCEERDAREIAVGSRGYGGFRAAALGSTSHALLHESDRPVLLITRRALARAALDDLQEPGCEVLDELEHDGPAAGEIHTELIEGPAAEVLVRVAHARDADEMVVGSQGLGRFRAAIGSVSHELLHEADLPLVVVPGSA